MLAHPFLYVPLLRLQRTSAQTRYGLQLFYHLIKTSRLRPRPRTVSLSVPRTNKYAGQRHCCWLSGQTRLWSDLSIDRSISHSVSQASNQSSNQSINRETSCDDAMSLCVCVYVSLSVCSSVCPLIYLKNHTFKLHEIFCTCYPVTSLGPPLTTSGFVNDVTFFIMGYMAGGMSSIYTPAPCWSN